MATLNAAEANKLTTALDDRLLAAKLKDHLDDVNTNLLGVTAGVQAASLPLIPDSNLELDGLGVIKVVDKLIATADVKQLNATPITVLSAVGSGVYPEFLGAYVFLDYATTAYADDAGEDLYFTNLSGGTAVSHTVDGSEFDGTADALVWVGPLAANAAVTTTLIDNGGFEVTIASGEWATGDSPLKIRLYYREIRKASMEAIA
jgi:hypothetical protein